MKTFYTILTVLFWLAVAFAAFNFVIFMGNSSMPNDGAMAAGHVIGALLGTAVIPFVVWIIRYFVGKEIKR